MKTTGTIHGWTLEQEVEQIEVTSMTAKMDPGWSYTDQAGHHHSYDTYDELVVVMREPYWCPDCRETHDTEVDHLECRDCGEHIVPGTRPSTYREFIPGMTTTTATAPDGTVYHLSPEMFTLLLERLKNPQPDVIAKLVAPHTVACPQGGTHAVGIEEGSSGVEYRFCRRCGEIFDGPVTL